MLWGNDRGNGGKMTWEMVGRGLEKWWENDRGNYRNNMGR